MVNRYLLDQLRGVQAGSRPAGGRLDRVIFAGMVVENHRHGLRLEAAAVQGDVSRMPDQLLPQPPPDVPAPGPSEAALRSRRKMWWLIGVGVGSIVLLALLPALGSSKSRHGKCWPGQTEVVSNARQIGLALYEFGNEYGKYPDSSTAAEVRRKTGTTLSLTDKTSNDLFAQLLAGQFTQSEKMFYTKAKSSVKPDGVWSSDATVLAHGECAFAYIMGVDPKGDPQTPLAFGPVIPGTKSFDRKSNEGKVVVLFNDNSVNNLPITPAGKVVMGSSLDFLDPRQPYWHGKAPDVKRPK